MNASSLLVFGVVLAVVSQLSLASNYYILQPQPSDLEPANSIAYPITEKDLYDQHSFVPYSFGYTARDSQHGSVHTREEHADGSGTVKGSYSYIDAHGLKRIVEYTADKGGFRANIKTNEPGTKTSAPADALYQSSAPILSPHDEYQSMESPKQPLLLQHGAALSGLSTLSSFGLVGLSGPEGKVY